MVSDPPRAPLESRFRILLKVSSFAKGCNQNENWVWPPTHLQYLCHTPQQSQYWPADRNEHVFELKRDRSTQLRWLFIRRFPRMSLSILVDKASQVERYLHGWQSIPHTGSFLVRWPNLCDRPTLRHLYEDVQEDIRGVPRGLGARAASDRPQSKRPSYLDPQRHSENDPGEKTRYAGSLEWRGLQCGSLFRRRQLTGGDVQVEACPQD